jgi:hypothetical protein
MDITYLDVPGTAVEPTVRFLKASVQLVVFLTGYCQIFGPAGTRVINKTRTAKHVQRIIFISTF